MRILFLGDLVGRAGRTLARERIPDLRETLALDAVVVNAEIAAHGFGLTAAIYEDLIAAGKDRPLKWGGTQVGGVDHIAAMAFGKATGSKIAYVPFDGGGEFLTALLGGDIEVAGFNVTETKDQIEAGDVRPLAAMADSPITALPDTPPLPSKGYDVIFSTVRGFVALKDTPADRLQTLEAGMLKALNHQTFQTYLTGSGLDASSVAGQEAWDRQIRKMYTSAEATMRELGLIK